MRRLFVVPLAAAAMLALPLGAPAETLGEPRVGFRAERVLVLDGRRYVGRMWNMPGEQRHEQALPPFDPVVILRADTAIGDILLPNLHTAVQFGLPRVLAALSRPDLLGKPVGKGSIEGIATTKFAVARTIPEGRLDGTLWLSRDGIPMRCDGRFVAANGRISTVHWELRHVEIGRQDAALFEVPRGYAKIPPEAAAGLLGLRLAPSVRH